MLVRKLHDLESNKLVNFNIYPVLPPMVEHSVTLWVTCLIKFGNLYAIGQAKFFTSVESARRDGDNIQSQLFKIKEN
jgi:DNA-binding HxlR family transcriptional regulator